MSIRVTLRGRERRGLLGWSGGPGKAGGGVLQPRGTPGRGHFQRKVPVPVQVVVELLRQRGWRVPPWRAVTGLEED